METPRQENLDSGNKEMELKIQELKDKWTKIVKQDPEGASAACFNFAERLRKNYGGQEECKKYASFQIIASGTFDLEDIKGFDFPGEDSIEKFIDDQLAKIEKDKKEK